MDKPKIPDFKLKTCCGSGAYGDVWIAEDKNGLKRAVKVLNKTRLKNLGVLDKELRGLQLYRKKAAKHPHLVEIYHVGETEQHVYYVMDLADDLSGDEDNYKPDTMAERLKVKKRFSIIESTYLVEKMLDALKVLHTAGLAHRDIKPGNIIYINGIPKLTDIGLITADVTGITLAGTMGFIPPERVSGSETDLYALGKLLYCLYTGNTAEQFPSLSGALNNNPEDKALNKFILKACNRNPNKRFKNVEEFREALEFGPHQSPKHIVITLVAILFLLTGATLISLNTGNAPETITQLEQKKNILPQTNETKKATPPLNDKLSSAHGKKIAQPNENINKLTLKDFWPLGSKPLKKNNLILLPAMGTLLLKEKLSENFEVKFECRKQKFSGWFYVMLFKSLPEHINEDLIQAKESLSEIPVITLGMDGKGFTTMRYWNGKSISVVAKPSAAKAQYRFNKFMKFKIKREADSLNVLLNGKDLFSLDGKLLFTGGFLGFSSNKDNVMSEIRNLNVTPSIANKANKKPQTKQNPLSITTEKKRQKIRPEISSQKPEIKMRKENTADLPTIKARAVTKGTTTAKLDTNLTSDEVKKEEQKKYVRTLFMEEQKPEIRGSRDLSNMGGGNVYVNKDLPDNFEIGLKFKFKKDVIPPRVYPKGFFDRIDLSARILSKDMRSGYRKRLGALMYSLKLINGKVSEFWYLGATRINGKRKEGRRILSKVDKIQIPIGGWNSLKILKTGEYLRYYINGKKICGAKMTFNQARFALYFSFGEVGIAAYDVHFLDFKNLKIYSLSELKEEKVDPSD